MGEEKAECGFGKKVIGREDCHAAAEKLVPGFNQLKDKDNEKWPRCGLFKDGAHSRSYLTQRDVMTHTCQDAATL